METVLWGNTTDSRRGGDASCCLREMRVPRLDRRQAVSASLLSLGVAPLSHWPAAAAATAAAGKPAHGRRRLASTATWEEAACDGRAELAVVLHAVPSGSPAGMGRGPKPKLPAGRAFHDALRNRNCK